MQPFLGTQVSLSFREAHFIWTALLPLNFYTFKDSPPPPPTRGKDGLDMRKGPDYCKVLKSGGFILTPVSVARMTFSYWAFVPSLPDSAEALMSDCFFKKTISLGFHHHDQLSVQRWKIVLSDKWWNQVLSHLMKRGRRPYIRPTFYFPSNVCCQSPY